MTFIRALVVLSFVACKSGGGGTADGHTGSDRSITYTFDGSNYSGSLLATATLQTNGGGGNALGIEASDSTGHTLAIAVGPATAEDKIATGTYNVSATPPPASFSLSDDTAGAWVANGSQGGSGSIDITSLTASEIQGTFSAAMVSSGSGSSGSLTDGAFDLTVN